MALWKITVKYTGIFNGCRLEKGMFIEMATNGANPIQYISKYKEEIGELFENKYGIDMLSANLVNSGRLDCERIN